MNIDVLVKCVEALIEKAAKAETPDTAMKFTQAACNAANALVQLQNVRSRKG